jgi:probable F420-dependent oxidoreductase
MKADVAIGLGDIASAGEEAASAEKDGYDGVWCGETTHDPFLPLTLAAISTTSVTVGTSIAVAFARSPMSLAVQANDLQLLSRGRFYLGIGSQVRAHIERRYSMPWTKPASRMREYILALRAIWAAWNERGVLDFEGEFYRHTLMSPFFDPGPNPYGSPRILLAAVGPRMTEVAGELCDGLIVHPLTSPSYLGQVTLPAVARGLAAARRSRQDFQVKYPAFVVTGQDAAALDRAKDATRRQIAFYASTPAYRPVLEFHGWGALGDELARLARSDRPERWDEMARLIDEEVLGVFAVIAEPERVAAAIRDRFAGLVDRISMYFTYPPAGVDVAAVMHELRHVPVSAGGEPA